MLPRTIDNRFEIDAEIAAGGMGMVYRARDRERGVPVAIKVLTTYRPADVERFARESALLAGFAHPGIVRYVAHGQINGEALYYAMDWVEGLTLGQRIDRDGLSARESVVMIGAIADALGHAHAAGIIHRDLKPSNVMLADGDANRPILIDFGIARRIREDVHLTRTGTALGTPGYMAPEQVRGVRELDARTDVFTLGSLLYEALAGVPAFGGATWLATQAKILISAPQSLRARVPTLPVELEALVEAMLAKDPELRPQDMRAVIDRLARVPVDVGASRHSSRVPAPDAETRAMTAASPCFVIAVVEADAHLDIAGDVAPFGGEVAPLLDGAVVVGLMPDSQDDSAVERAARCALALRAKYPRWPLAIVADAERALDEAARQLVASEITAAARRVSPAIRLDARAATLLAGTFEIRSDRVGMTLVAR
jgi:eukaryotic-like serine/threonine-protein kinase